MSDLLTVKGEVLVLKEVCAKSADEYKTKREKYMDTLTELFAPYFVEELTTAYSTNIGKDYKPSPKQLPFYVLSCEKLRKHPQFDEDLLLSNNLSELDELTREVAHKIFTKAKLPNICSLKHDSEFGPTPIGFYRTD
jgi:hypothetical protein